MARDAGRSAPAEAGGGSSAASAASVAAQLAASAVASLRSPVPSAPPQPPQLPPQPQPAAASSSFSSASTSSSSAAVLTYDPSAGAGGEGGPPALYVDVTISAGSVERIPVWRHSDVAQLAVAFAAKHGLSAKLGKRLEKMIEAEAARAGVDLGGASAAATSL